MQRLAPAEKRERFDRLYAQYADDVLRMAYLYLANRQQAEDVAQDVFLRLYTRGDGIAPGKERAWLMAVTVNRCRDYWRSGWVKRMVHGEEMLAMIPAEEDDRLEDREEKEAVLRAVHRLAPPFRDVVLLHYYRGLKLDQIAESLGISRGTAASRLARARDKVKGYMREEGYHD